MSAVCNTSPLILLARIGRVELLSTLYGVVAVPPAVLNEISVRQDPILEKIQAEIDQVAIQVREADKNRLTDINEQLGAGEREAIALAIAIDPTVIVLDDHQGRLTAPGVRT